MEKKVIKGQKPVEDSKKFFEGKTTVNKVPVTEKRVVVPTKKVIVKKIVKKPSELNQKVISTEEKSLVQKPVTTNAESVAKKAVAPKKKVVSKPAVKPAQVNKKPTKAVSPKTNEWAGSNQKVVKKTISNPSSAPVKKEAVSQNKVLVKKVVSKPVAKPVQATKESEKKVATENNTSMTPAKEEVKKPVTQNKTPVTIKKVVSKPAPQPTQANKGLEKKEAVPQKKVAPQPTPENKKLEKKVVEENKAPVSKIKQPEYTKIEISGVQDLLNKVGNKTFIDIHNEIKKLNPGFFEKGFSGTFDSKKELVSFFKERIFDFFKGRRDEIKSIITELRKAGKEVSYLDLKSLSLPLKMKVLMVHFSFEEFNKLNLLFSDVESSLNEIKKEFDLEQKKEKELEEKKMKEAREKAQGIEGAKKNQIKEKEPAEKNIKKSSKNVVLKKKVVAKNKETTN